MVEAQERPVGRFSVELELVNADELARARAGDIPAAQVSRTRVPGVVDTGAARLVIPAAVAQDLRLPVSGKAKVRYADGHTEEREIVRGVHLSYGGREGVFSAIVEPSRDSALVGAIVLEDLDFLVDCTGQRLVPRDPHQIVSEIE